MEDLDVKGKGLKPGVVLWSAYSKSERRWCYVCVSSEETCEIYSYES